MRILKLNIFLMYSQFKFIIKQYLYFFLKRTKNNLKYNFLRLKISRFRIKYSNVKKDSHYVIIWEFGGFDSFLEKHASLALALNVRGHKVHFVLCSGDSEACIQRESEKNIVKEWGASCVTCRKSMLRKIKKYGLNYSFSNEYIDEEQKNIFKNISEKISLDNIKSYQYLDVNVGEHALSSFIRYGMGRCLSIVENLSKEDELIYRKYFYASLVNTYVAQEVVTQFKPISFLTSHGMYVDYAAPMFLFYKKGIPCIYWTSGFLKFTQYYSSPERKNCLISRRISELEWQNRHQKFLQPKEEKKLDDFFSSRYVSKKMMDTFFFDDFEEASRLREKLDVKNDKMTVCLFSHLNWDACIDFSEMLFDDPYEWVVESISKMSKISDVNWLIKIHPAEELFKNFYGTKNEIEKNFKKLPENVKILTADSTINSYGFYKIVDIGITIMGAVGVELPCLGKPIITAGKAHFSGKGFSLDAKSKKEYFNYLENIRDIKPLTAEQIKLARQYAYSYFIERQVPLNIIDRKQGHWGDLDSNRLDELLPGKDPVLDKLCECIISGKDVILDEKELEFIDKKNRELNL